MTQRPDDKQEQAARRPSPTSRARRIGGAARPQPARPAEHPGTADATAEAAAETAETAAESDAATTAAVKAPEWPAEAPTAGPSEPPHDIGSPASEGSSGVPARWVPAGVLGIVVLALLIIEIVVSHGVYWAKSATSDSARTVNQEQVLAAAKKCFAQINTYDYRHLDGLTDRDLSCTTGQFTSDVRQALQTQILRLAPKLHAVQTAQINKAGISSVNQAGDQVVTLIFGQLAQSNNSTAKASPRIDVIGAVVTVDKVHGRWLISKVAADAGSVTGS